MIDRRVKDIRKVVGSANQKLTKCSFCVYKTASGCTVVPNSYNCRAANNEFFYWLAQQKKGS